VADDLESAMYEAGLALLKRDDRACASAIRRSYSMMEERRALDHGFYENLLKTAFEAGLEESVAVSFDCLCGAALHGEKVWEQGLWYFGDLIRQFVERGYEGASSSALDAFNGLGVKTGMVANDDQVFFGYMALLRGMYEAKFRKVIAPERPSRERAKEIAAARSLTMFPTEPPE
jgi:hypothetical protein